MSDSITRGCNLQTPWHITDGFSGARTSPLLVDSDAVGRFRGLHAY